MSRNFNSPSTGHYLQWAYNAALFNNWTWGTIAAWIKRSADGATYRGLLLNINAANNDLGFGFLIGATNLVDLWSATSGVDILSTTTVVAADGWCLIGVTKTTGGTPRFHIYKQSANTWVHENGGGTQADNTDVNTSGIGGLWVGDYVGDTSGGGFQGDIAAIMALNRIVLDDSAFERLARGSWDQWIQKQTDFLVEFPSGRDHGVITDTIVTTDMARQRQTGGVGTSRSATADPPGFRFSRLTRRQ